MTPFKTDRPRDLIFIRHGRTEGNRQRCLQGRQGLPLDEEGKAQVKKQAMALKNALPSQEKERPSIWSSPVLRARESAALIWTFLELKKGVQIHQGLSELEMGDWEGELIPSLQSLPAWEAFIQHPERTTFPNGETLRQAQVRVLAALDEILHIERAGTVIIVSHGGPLRLLTLSLLGLGLEKYHRLHMNLGSRTRFRLIPEQEVHFYGMNQSVKMQHRLL